MSDTLKTTDAALRAKIPADQVIDDSLYASLPNSLLQPGVPIASSPSPVSENGRSILQFKSTTSGVLVVDEFGTRFLNSGLRYVNEVFGDAGVTVGKTINGIHQAIILTFASVWAKFENGMEPVDGACGSAILDDEGKLVAFFQFQDQKSGECVGASGMELRSHGYEICGGIQQF
ncbi:MAG: hypothetical protein MMC33_008573 [Icmadophila ericetorum]|nr:hypothetical protein [Icmadophila ericetorum]